MNIVQIQSRVQELPNSPQTMQYLNAAMNGQVTTVPPYIAAAELKRRETEGMMDQLAKGAAQAQQTTVKDQLQQKMGVMALMGQQQPPQQPQIPQPAPPEQQAQAGGIDSLPVKEDMFGMAGGGIVAFGGGGRAESYETPYDRMNRGNREDAAQRAVSQPLDIRVLTRLYQQNPQLAEEAARNAGPAGAALLQRVVQSAQSTGPRLGSVPAEREGERAAQRQIAIQNAITAPAVSNAYPDETRRGAAAGLMGMAAPPPGQRPPGQRPPTAGGQRPPGPQGAPSAAAPQDAQGIKSLVDQAKTDPSYLRMMQGVNENNPYGGPQETQSDYIKRMTEGIRSQMPGGQMPFETSEARLKEIEARRAKEDTEYAESNKGRQLDNLLTMISGMGRGSFGNAGVQGIQAVQGVERSQREADLKRKDMRDQQSMKLMEIRSLNEQAQMALAQGNVQAYEKLTQEAKKLKADFDKDQAMLAKGATQVTAGAREKDLESADKARDRVSREKMARMGLDSRAAGAESKEVAAAEAAFARDPNAKALSKVLETLATNPESPKYRAVVQQLNDIRADKYRQAGATLQAAPGAKGPGGNTRLQFDAKGNPI